MELLKDKVIVRVSSDEARKIREAGCDIVCLFPTVYMRRNFARVLR
jgi:hypothetical protein